jgi:hypothetical protein
MRTAMRLTILAGCWLLWDVAPAWAGMPSIRLTDVAKLRVHNLSFFVAVFLLAALGIQVIWNVVRRDFTFLPRLSYLRALGVVALWGMLFVLVLTMIAGARELLTPGAWEKEGLTYKLRDTPTPPDPGSSPLKIRKEKIEKLRKALWEYARTHEGRYPPGPTDPAIAPEVWRVPDGSGMRYVYLVDRERKGERTPLALEPESLGKARFVLFTDGAIRLLSREELSQALEGVQP